MIYPIEKVPKAITEISITRAFTHTINNEHCQFDTWKSYKHVVDCDTLTKCTFLYAENIYWQIVSCYSTKL